MHGQQHCTHHGGGANVRSNRLLTATSKPNTAQRFTAINSTFSITHNKRTCCKLWEYTCHQLNLLNEQRSQRSAYGTKHSVGRLQCVAIDCFRILIIRHNGLSWYHRYFWHHRCSARSTVVKVDIVDNCSTLDFCLSNALQPAERHSFWIPTFTHKVKTNR